MKAARLSTLGLLLAATVAAHAQAAHAQDAAPSLNPLAGIDKASLHGFVEAPLFEPSRQAPSVAAPAVVELPPPVAVVEQPPSMHILGVVEGAHSLLAIVHRDDSGKTETLHSGDRIGGWSIAVLPTGVRVSAGDRAFDYALFRGPQAGPVAVVPASAAPSLAARETGR